MSNYSLIAVVCFVMVSAVVMAYCQRVEREENPLDFRVSFRYWLVFLACVIVMLFSMVPNANAGPKDPEWNPPSRFDHPYSGQMIIHRVQVDMVDEACISLYMKHDRVAWRWQISATQHGCSFVQDSVCEVVIPKGAVMKATPVAILRHETGHCNGWTGKHED